jgi:hypothetical protein
LCCLSVCLSRRPVQCQTADGSHCVTSRLPHSKRITVTTIHVQQHKVTSIGIRNQHLLAELITCNSLLQRFPRSTPLLTLLLLLLLYTKPALNLLLCAHSRYVRTFSMFLPPSHAAQYCTFCIPNVTLHKLHGLQLHNFCHKFGKNRSNVSNSKQEINRALMSEIHFVLPRRAMYIPDSIVTHSLYYETPWHGKETMGSFCIVVELQNISYCLNKCAMFVHVETNLYFLDRLSQISPIPNLKTRLVTAEVTHRTDRRTYGWRGERQRTMRATYSKKPKREEGSHEHPVQLGTY